MPLQVVPDGSELHFPGGTRRKVGLVCKGAGPEAGLPAQPAAASATMAASAAHTRDQRREFRSPDAIRADRVPVMVTTSFLRQEYRSGMCRRWPGMCLVGAQLAVGWVALARASAGRRPGTLPTRRAP